MGCKECTILDNNFTKVCNSLSHFSSVLLHSSPFIIPLLSPPPPISFLSPYLRLLSILVTSTSSVYLLSRHIYHILIPQSSSRFSEFSLFVSSYHFTRSYLLSQFPIPQISSPLFTQCSLSSYSLAPLQSPTILSYFILLLFSHTHAR